MKRISAFIVLLFSFCALASAQAVKVSGNVSDDANEALAGTIIMVKNSKGEVKQSSSTDNAGNYSISCSRGDVIEFHYLGFDQVSIPFDGKPRLDVKMVQT